MIIIRMLGEGARVSSEVDVCEVEELSPGDRKIVRHDGREIGIFNVNGRYFALRNRCPHQAGPLCLGRVGGVISASEPHEYVYEEDPSLVSCPWHHWEFRLEDGTCLTDQKARVKTYKVGVKAGRVTLYL